MRNSALYISIDMYARWAIQYRKMEYGLDQNIEENRNEKHQ